MPPTARLKRQAAGRKNFEARITNIDDRLRKIFAIGKRIERRSQN
jgi:hypothetical protein